MKRNLYLPLKFNIRAGQGTEDTEAPQERLEEAIKAAINQAIRDSGIGQAGATIFESSNVPTGGTEELQENVRLDRLDEEGSRYKVPSYNEGGLSVELPVLNQDAFELKKGLDTWIFNDLQIDPEAINWHTVLPQLLSTPPPEPLTEVEASYYERYYLYLGLLNEALQQVWDYEGYRAELENQQSAGYYQEELTRLNIQALSKSIRQYIEQKPYEVFSQETMHYYAGSFLADWLKTLEGLEFIPEGFHLSAYKPTATEEELEEERQEIFKSFWLKKAPGLITLFILNKWTESRLLPPDEWLARISLEELKATLVEHLAEEFLNLAFKDRRYAAGLRYAAWDREEYLLINAIYQLARLSEEQNQGLCRRLREYHTEEFLEAEMDIARKPIEYLDLQQKLSRITYRFLSEIRPGRAIGEDLISWAEGLLSTYNLDENYAPLIVLAQLAAYVQQLKALVEKQKTETREGIKEVLILRYGQITGIVKAHLDQAEEFIRTKWLPTLKEVAKEKLLRNKKELEQIYADWDQANAKFVQALLDGAREFDGLAWLLKQGEIQAVKLKGHYLRKAQLPEIENAAKLMRLEAEARQDPEGAAEKKEELKEALEVYATVISDLESDQYDPLDYSAAVYDEAKQILKIGKFPLGSTTGMVLQAQVTADKNPFLARAIEGWRWKEESSRQIKSCALLMALGMFTLATLVLASGLTFLVLTALDIGIAVGMGVKSIFDAREILNMAKLDTRGDIRGLTVEQAEKALNNAWISTAIPLMFALGIGAFYARLSFLMRKTPRVAETFSELRTIWGFTNEEALAYVKFGGRLAAGEQAILKKGILLLSEGQSVPPARLFQMAELFNRIGIKDRFIFNAANHVQLIWASKRFLAGAEGAVYGSRMPLTTFWQRLRAGLTFEKREGLIIFQGRAARLFHPHEIEGGYSGLKRLLGQYKSGFGDIVIDRASRQGRLIVVTEAHLATPREILHLGQTTARARARLWGRRLIIEPFATALIPLAGYGAYTIFKTEGDDAPENLEGLYLVPKMED